MPAGDDRPPARCRVGRPIVLGAPKTVGELLTKWLQHVSASVRPNTYAAWESLCRLHLIPELGHLRLSTLHQRDLNARL